MRSDERARVPAYVMYADFSATAFGDLALPDLPNQVDRFQPAGPAHTGFPAPAAPAPHG